MQRRNFIKNSTLCAVAISASGFIRYDGYSYTSDCETTSDILGPFYRPGSPVRNNLRMKGDAGEPIELSGVVNHKDCRTPFKNARVELWHCDGKGVYDNSSDQYRYRGTAFTNDKGKYSFDTILPIAYDTGGGNFRPAHFHMMITAEGYQPLVTQLYFTGDAYLTGDPYASSPSAKKRILEVQGHNGGHKKVVYNVGMSEKLHAEPASIDKLTGVYVDEQDGSKKIEFFKKDNLMWSKNEIFGEHLEYEGNNSFQYPGMPAGESWTYYFEMLASGVVKVTQTFMNGNGEKKISTARKVTK